MKLDEYSFSMILKTLARGLAKLRKELKARLHNSDHTKIQILQAQIPEKDSEESPSHDLITKEQIPVEDFVHSLEEAKTPENLIQEINNIYEKAVELWKKINTEYAVLINNHILDAYLKVLCSVPATKEAYDRALTFFRGSECTESSRGQGYFCLLAFVIRSPDVFKECGPSLWREFLAWDNAQESKLSVERLTEIEKEQIRVTENRDRNSIFMAFIWMVRGYARAGNNEEAVSILKNSQEFRSLDYLRPVFFRDIWVLVKRARDESEDGKWKLAQELSEICSNSTTDPLQAVQSSMKQNLMPKKWWGWKAVGIDEVELKRLTKKNKRIKHKAKQIADSKRRPKHRK